MTLPPLNGLRAADILPEDADRATLVGRIWDPAAGGPTPVLLRQGKAIDISRIAPTLSGLFELENPVAALQKAVGMPEIAAVDQLIANSDERARDPQRPWLLAPCDLQAVKAAGVTFVSSMLERVIEEQARGDFSRAEEIRARITGIIGDNLSVKPGSPEAQKVKEVLLAAGAWSQYLEVGIGPDAEIFTKCPAMASVGLGADIGLHPKSQWSNPEPEIVLAANSRGEVVGAALGNDVNLRDFEGRSALLLGKAKDNNASSAIGPFVRLFDKHFSIDDVRQAVITVNVTGREDGFVMEGSSSMAKISRDPLDLASQALNATHQYPDGFMLFLGTMFAPIQDRGKPGMGFTHKVGDAVSISSPRLGKLWNRVDHSDKVAPWTFGITALMRNLVHRQLVG